MNEVKNEVQPTPAALPVGLTAKAKSAITSNIVLIMGAAVLAVIVGSILLSWFDKAIPEAVIAMAGVAMGYLGNAIQESNKDA